MVKAKNYFVFFSHSLPSFSVRIYWWISFLEGHQVDCWVAIDPFPLAFLLKRPCDTICFCLTDLLSILVWNNNFSGLCSQRYPFHGHMYLRASVDRMVFVVCVHTKVFIFVTSDIFHRNTRILVNNTKTFSNVMSICPWPSPPAIVY